MYNYRPVYDNEIYHYGVVGMKWGVRRYQNPDGTLTDAGKKHYGSADPNDNKKAYELGRAATVSARASQIASKKAQKASDRYAKNPTEGRYQKKQLAESVANAARSNYEKNAKAVEEHASFLKQKYGDQNVSEITYDKNGYIAESVSTNKQKTVGVIASAGVTAASVALAAVGVLPFYTIAMIGPKSANELGRDEYTRLVREEKSRR